MCTQLGTNVVNYNVRNYVHVHVCCQTQRILTKKGLINLQENEWTQSFITKRARKPY